MQLAIFIRIYAPFCLNRSSFPRILIDFKIWLDEPETIPKIWTLTFTRALLK